MGAQNRERGVRDGFTEKRKSARSVSSRAGIFAAFNYFWINSPTKANAKVFK